ncbi:ArnT family glycosyltransferase [Frondihabitans peucedani]|uniref:4-amino-4-deoxy-L-arabinose transferase-like glycosyltransferase n=1 Tax=Frondihabitans peucedani TaxID=598626 RepID=A0ABP8E147_9MICO
MTRPHEARWLLALAALVACFVVVATWNLGTAGYSEFYASAAHSMTVSGGAFWSGSFDPAATITLDKLSGFLVPQALSARLFGFHEWSLALPQVVEGAVTIVAVFVIGRRLRGPGTGLLAAGAFAVTPLMVSMFGHTMEDGLLTMSLAVAFVFFQRSVETGRVRDLVLAGIVVGIGFQAKMLQAWFIVPALVVAVLVAGRPLLRSRLKRGLLLIGVVIVASLAWMTVMQLIPAGSRPFFDGSREDDVFTQVFGYNGLNRFVPGLIPGAAPTFHSPTLSPGSDGISPLKLLEPAFATQVGWFFPLALAGLVGSPRRRAQDHATATTTIALGGWLVTSVAVLSVTAIPHTAYLAAVSVQVSLFAAIGLRDSAAAARQGRPAPLLAVVGVSTAWSLVLLVKSTVAPTWLIAVVALTGGLAVVVLAGVLVSRVVLSRVLVSRVLVSARLPRARRPRRAPRGGLALVVTVATALGAAALVAAPSVWTLSTLDPALAGTANDAYAGPRPQRVGFFFQTDAPPADRESFDRFRVEPPVWSAPDVALTPEQESLVRFTRRNIDGGPLFTTTSWFEAAPYLIAAGLDVRSIGGFSGAIPTPTLGEVRRGVADGSLRYFLLPSRSTPRAGSAGGRTEAGRITAWVTASCSLVPDSRYEGTTTLAGLSLWDCRVR